MAKKPWPKITRKVLKSGRETFMVDARINGEGERLFFETNVEAKTMAEQLRIKRKNEGHSAFMLTAAERIDAEAALAMLRPHNIDLRAAADFAIKNMLVVKSDVLVRDLVTELLAIKKADGKSKYYLHGISSTWKRFAASFSDVKVSDVKAPMAEDWLRNLDGLEGSSRNVMQTHLCILFSHAERRHYCIDNPFAGMARAKTSDKMPAVLSVAECARLLSVAHPRVIPALALGLFAGVRPWSEGCRLDWSHIDLEGRQIDIAPGNTKNKKSVRYIPIQENLVEWLMLFRRKSGPVIESVDIYDTLRHQAAKAAGIKRWPHDVLRHTFASMHHAHFPETQGVLNTPKQMGHSGDDIFYRHYRNRVNQSEAALFWSIRPIVRPQSIKHPDLLFGELLKEALESRERGGVGSFNKRCKEQDRVCTHFANAHPRLRVSETEKSDIDRWLASLPVSESSRHSYRYRIVNLLQYAREKGYCLTNPASDEEAFPEIEAVIGQENKILQMTA